MANTGFPQANGGFPQVPQQGFPQAAQSGNIPYGFAQQSNNVGQNSDDQWGTQQDEQWGTQRDSTGQDAQDSTEQPSQGFGNTTNAASPTQAGYSKQPKSLFPQDDQATTVLPPMQQMGNTSNVGYWSNQQQNQPVAYQPTTYQADLPVKPKEGIRYYDGRPLHWGKESKKVDVYAVKEGAVRCGYLFGNKITHDLVEVLGYSTPKNNEYSLMKSPKMVGFKGVALEDTGNLYNAAELRKALEKNGATPVSDTLYLVDKEHTEQWALN